MSKLYELAQNYANIIDLIEDDSIPAEAIETALKAVEADITVKAESIAKLDANLAGSQSQFEAEIERLTKRKNAIKNRRAQLKEFLKVQLESIKIKKLKAGVFSITVQNNPPALQIIDDKLIPAEYQTIVPAYYELQKDKIKSDLKAGKIIEGAQLTTGTALHIR